MTTEIPLNRKFLDEPGNSEIINSRSNFRQAKQNDFRRRISSIYEVEKFKRSQDEPGTL
jgi:hypothetical protein